MGILYRLYEDDIQVLGIPGDYFRKLQHRNAGEPTPACLQYPKEAMRKWGGKLPNQAHKLY